MTGVKRTIVAAAVAAILVPAMAAAQAGDDGPRLGFSVAEPRPTNRTDGPLMNRAKAALAAARQGDAAYARFLAPRAEAELVTFANGARQAAPFTAVTIRAASESCHGPMPYDEGRDWVQLSWVCRVDGVGPLARLLAFQNSPELSLTIWFEGDRIKRIEAMEPLMIPMARRVAMNAWEVLQERR